MTFELTTLADLRTEARALLMEKQARVISDDDLNRWANKGIRNWSAYVKWYERIVAFPITALNPILVLPDDTLSLQMIRWQDRGRMRSVDMSTHAERTFSSIGSGNPFRYVNTPKNKRLIMSPAPTVGSYTTTLSGALSDTATSIAVASVTNFPTTGRLIIDYGLGNQEQVEYYNVDTATNSFLLCRRGDGDTAPVTHAPGATVYEGKIVVYTKAMPADLVNDTDRSLMPEQYIEAIPFFMAGYGEIKRGDTQKGSNFLETYKNLREEAAEEAAIEPNDGSEGIKDEEFGMGWYGDI